MQKNEHEKTEAKIYDETIDPDASLAEPSADETHKTSTANILPKIQISTTKIQLKCILENETNFTRKTNLPQITTVFAALAENCEYVLLYLKILW